MGKVVVCEDDLAIQKLIRAGLRASIHEVRIAGDGMEGLRLIEADPPDLVVTDVSMPRMDGFQLGDAIRSRPALRNIPLMYITASVEDSAIEECYRHGATAFLAKPFTMIDLRQRIDDLIQAAVSGVQLPEETPDPAA